MMGGKKWEHGRWNDMLASKVSEVEARERKMKAGGRRTHVVSGPYSLLMRCECCSRMLGFLVGGLGRLMDGMQGELDGARLSAAAAVVVVVLNRVRGHPTVHTVPIPTA